MINPQKVYLQGPAGDVISARVTITPDKAFPFKVLGSAAKKGEFIRLKVEEVEVVEKRYLLTVENLKPDPGRYSDVITLKTDSEILPDLKIFVTGNITSPEIAEISPKRVMLKGPVGEVRPQAVMIKPKKGYAFKILECSPGRRKNIDCEFKEIKNNGNKGYWVTVSNLKKKPGRYSDTITLKTDSKVQPEISVSVNGDIRAGEMATITPAEINLVGLSGERIQKRVRIICRKKYPFKILDVALKNGENIKYTLEKVETAASLGYLLTVQNLKKEKGLYEDLIYLKTDSRIQPELKIRVNGIFFGKDQKQYYDIYKDAMKK